MKGPIRVLVVDDSPTARLLLVRTLESAGDIRVVGTASDGQEAITRAGELQPDIITMDVRMPNMDGLVATREIMARFPTPIVIVSGSVNEPELAIAFNALEAGAVDVIEKPPSASREDYEPIRQRLLASVRAMSEVKVVRRRLPPGPLHSAFSAKGRHYSVLAVGASTGGPQALERIFTLLHADFPAPILIVQHMTPGFLRGFASWLNGTGKTPVKIAEDGETLVPGVAYIAPDSRHLRLGERFRAYFGDDTPRGLFRPSVDVLFDSVARNAGPTGVGLILTGMGSDGAAGLKRMREAGSMCLAQDPLSCVVPGMPSAAKSQGAVEHEVDLERISAVLETLFPRTH